MRGPDPRLVLAARVVTTLEKHGVAAVLIGAGALAVHNYTRMTVDLDLGTDVNPFGPLRTARDELASLGFDVVLRTPDAEDPLGGVLEVTGSLGETVEVVNFYNPRSARPTNVGREAIKHAIPAGIEGIDLLVVDLPHLIALKLYAGGAKSRSDVIGLLEANPDADLARIREVCDGLELGAELRLLFLDLGIDAS